MTSTSLGRALFVGSGDSLSACLLAERAGHLCLSAGDVAWTGWLPPGIDTVVGVSHSGNTAATVAAVDLAAARGLPTIAVTVAADSALAAAASEVRLAEPVTADEVIPAAGFLTLAATVLSVIGAPLDGGLPAVDARLSAMLTSAVPLPALIPSAISVLTLPDLRATGDFWSLKLIEATGLAVRSVPLEESGHVDYFIGPQPHLSISLIGSSGVDRHARLSAALAANGHTTTSLHVSDDDPSRLAAAALGARVAETAAALWVRPPFRNHEVPMDARHIQLG